MARRRSSQGRCASPIAAAPAFNVGDGPAAFLTLGVGALVAVLAITVELGFAPPWWVHLIWLPVTLALVVGGLRIGKAALLASEYRHRAGEERTL